MAMKEQFLFYIRVKEFEVEQVYVRAFFRPNNQGERCSASNALQTARAPSMQSGNDKVRNSTREESNVRYGMNILHAIVKMGEKRNRASELRPKKSAAFLMHCRRCGKIANAAETTK